MLFNNKEISSLIRNNKTHSPYRNGLALLQQQLVSFALSASIPADNGALLVNPARGPFPGGRTGYATVISLINLVSGSTIYLTNGLVDYTVGRQVTHFNADQTVRGVIQLASRVDNFQITFSVVSGDVPVAGGYLLAPSYDFTVAYAKFTWKQLEPTKGAYDWANLELATGLTAIKNLGKQYVLYMVLDNPSSSAHYDVPDWYYTESGMDGTAYDEGASQKGWYPNYANVSLVGYHQAAVNALAARYGSDPQLFRVKLGSVGRWGEWNMATFPANAVVQPYIDHYVEAFGAGKCNIRRTVGTSAAQGLSTFNDGYLSYTQVYDTIMGSADHNTAVAATDAYGISQAGYGTRAAWLASGIKWGEPINDPIDAMFAGEPVSLVDDSTNWVLGQKWTQVTNPAKTADVKYACINAYVAAAYTTYYVVCHPDYEMALTNTQSNGTYISTPMRQNGTTMAFASNVARLYLSIHRVDNADMTAEDIIRALPRLYLNTETYKARNKRLSKGLMREYPISMYTTPFDADKRVTPVVSATNIKEIDNYMGYRIRPTAASLVDKTLTVTLANDGNDRPWCGERRLKVGLFSGTTLVKEWESSTRVDDIAGNGGTKAVDIVLDTVAAGVYTLAIGICTPSGSPDIALPATALTGKWFGIGTVTVTV